MGHAPDEVYKKVRRELSDEKLIALSIAIGAINLWNRTAIVFHNKQYKNRGRAT